MGSDPDETSADTVDPAVIDVLVVTAGDVVSALEARYQRDRPVVLRVTPPFSGRMRARLHVDRDGSTDRNSDATDATDEQGPLHVGPERFVDDPPPYPRPAETEDELRADPSEEYTVERHRERHAAVVEEWRERVRAHFLTETIIETPAGEQPVDVVVLGD